MTMLALAAIAFSTALIILLCRGDPKRRRSAGLSGDGMSATTRRLIAAMACLPGAYCAALGDAAAFLIWLGGCAAGGWLIALLFARTARKQGNGSPAR